MENQGNIVRLAKPVKKGLMRLLFSRFFVFGILLIAQVALMFAVYFWFADQLPVLLEIQWVFAFAMIIYLFNCSMDSSAKLTWMLIISILPPLGAALLLWTQANIGHRKTTELAKEQMDKTTDILKQSDDIFRQVEHDGSGTDDLSKYLSRSGCFPLYGNTKVTFLSLESISSKQCSSSLKRLKSSSSWSTS